MRFIGLLISALAELTSVSSAFVHFYRLQLSTATVCQVHFWCAAARGGSNAGSAAELKEQLRKRRRLNSGGEAAPVKQEEEEGADEKASTPKSEVRCDVVLHAAAQSDE